MRRWFKHRFGHRHDPVADAVSDDGRSYYHCRHCHYPGFRHTPREPITWHPLA